MDGASLLGSEREVLEQGGDELLRQDGLQRAAIVSDWCEGLKELKEAEQRKGLVTRSAAHSNCQ